MTAEEWKQLHAWVEEHQRKLEWMQKRECCGLPTCGWTMPAPCQCETHDCPEEGHAR